MAKSKNSDVLHFSATNYEMRINYVINNKNHQVTIMSIFHQECLHYMSQFDIPHVFVETGTFLGDGVNAVKDHFREVHSIELHEGHANIAKYIFKDSPHVHIHQGDSASVLERLCEEIKEPCIFYLDAHYSGGNTAFGDASDNGCPVLRELNAIGKRKYNDVVFVDDMRLMGKACFSGTKDSDIYPVTYFDFTHATNENMLRNYERPCKTYSCKSFDRMLIIPHSISSESQQDIHSG